MFIFEVSLLLKPSFIPAGGRIPPISPVLSSLGMKNMDPKLKEILETLTNFNPCDYAVGNKGKEISIHLIEGSKKAVILKDDGTWDFKQI